jgi:hypothetical protein
MTIDPSTSPCNVPSQVDQRTMYYYDLGNGQEVYAALDGTTYCIH